MPGGGLEGGHDAVVVVVGVGVDLGEPDHLLGVDRLAVDDCGDLPVTPAGVEADAAALQVAAHGLGGVLGYGDVVHQDDLEGVLKDGGHVVPVELLPAAGAVDAPEILRDALVAADVDLEAALHPQDGLDQAVDIVVVRLGHLRGAVDKGAAGGHLSVGPLHGDAHRLFGGLQEGAVKAHEGDKFRIQRGNVLQLN